MPYLKYYQIEHETYPIEHEFGLSHGSAYLLTKTLLYNYGVGGIKVKFILHGNLGTANWTKKIIKYHKYKPPSMLLVIHEVSHLVDRKRNGTFRGRRAHSKKHARIVKELIKFCRGNKYFHLEKFDSGETWNPEINIINT